MFWTGRLLPVSARYHEARSVYVHGETMVIDDAWATIGWCNVHVGPLSGNSEMNASIWDPAVARGLRLSFLPKTSGRTRDISTPAWRCSSMGALPPRKRRRWDLSETDWQGLAFRLDPEAYGG
jgi:cardiolipin synthase A/B